MSQGDQILRRLEEAGDRGVHSFHLKPIAWRYAARIKDLKELGHEITSETEKLGDAVGVRYKLVGRSTGSSGATAEVSSFSTSAPESSATSSQETVLSLEDVRHPAPSMYDPMSDAA